MNIKQEEKATSSFSHKSLFTICSPSADSPEGVRGGRRGGVRHFFSTMRRVAAM